MNETLITAKSMEKQIKSNAAAEADIVVREARNEADHIVTDAKSQAKDILTDAISKAKQLAKETDDLKAKTRVFHQRLSLMLETQLKGMQSSDWDEILQPFSASVGEDHQAFKEVLEGKTTAETLDKDEAAEVQSVAQAPANQEPEEGTMPAVEMGEEEEPSYIDHLTEEEPQAKEEAFQANQEPSAKEEEAQEGEVESPFPSEESSEVAAPSEEENQ
jgi:cell division initiation protein